MRMKFKEDLGKGGKSIGKPDAWKLARPVWGWGRGATPRPTPHVPYVLVPYVLAPFVVNSNHEGHGVHKAPKI